MIQLKVYPFEGALNEDAIFLDLYESQPIKLTLSIEDITSADATSVYSRTFKVPATRGNNEFFENAWELDSIDFDITIKKPAQILVDGSEFKTGHVRLQKIFANGDLDKVDYELLFLGETRDFSSAVGELTMCQLTFTEFDWDDLPVSYDAANAAAFAANIGQQDVRDSWDAFPQSASLSAGYADGDMVFPLIDHGNSYDSDGDLNAPAISIGNSGSDMSFTHSGNALPAQRFKPMIRAKRIWDQIFQNTGYTYESNFLDSEQFRHMYVSAFGNQESITIGVEQDVGGGGFGNASSNTFQYFEQPNGNNDAQSYLYCSNQVVASPNYYINTPDVTGPTGGSYFIAPGDAALGGAYYAFEYGAQVSAAIENSDYGYTDVDLAVQLMVVDSITASPNDPNNVTLDVGNFTSSGNWSSSAYDSRNGGYQPQTGDIFKIFVTNNYSYDVSEVGQAYWHCNAAPGPYNPGRDLDCEYQQIDFIKDVITMFRLVMQPDPLRPNHFIIEPWKDFIGSGDVYDWSDKMIREKDFVSEPLFNTQSAIIEYTKQEDEDFINTFHQDNNKHAYGWLRFDSQNELLKGKRDVEVTGIAPTPIDQIFDTQGSTAHTNPEFILPQIYNFEDNQRLPIKPKTRFLFYNGLVTTDGTTWWFKTGPNTYEDFQTYPLASPYEYWPITNIPESPGPPPVEAVNTLNLNFSNDNRYYMDPAPSAAYGELPNTLFEIFWARYISSLYNKFSRRVTAYFTLNNVDLQNLTFDDVIFIDGKYYRPEKVIDAQIGQRTAVKVQLINVLDQRPVWRPEPLTGFSITETDGQCAGEQGTIQVTTDGTPPFNWQLGDPAIAQGQYNSNVGQAPYIFTIEDVPLGSDILIVTDSLGRTAQVTYTINQSTASPVAANQTVTDATDCSSPCNGQISVTAFGGSGSGYTITWQDPNVSGFNPTGLCPGDYLYYITDGAGCQSDTYEASVSCSIVTYTYEVREHLNNCSQLSVQTYAVESTLQYAVGDTVALDNKNGCFAIMGTTQDQPQFTIVQDFPDCASCSPVTPNSYEVQSCTTGAYMFISRSPYTLQPGNIVKLQNTPGCWEVMGDDPSQPTDTPIQLHKTCALCSGPVSYTYLFAFCDGSGTGVYTFSSGIPLQIGDVLEVQTSTVPSYVGKCVRVVATSTNTPIGSVDTTTVYDDCTSCQGITIQQCHEVVVSGSGAEITYVQNNQSYGPSYYGPGTYNICASSYTFTGSAVFTPMGTLCITNIDCRPIRVKPSCHSLYGGTFFAGTTFEYMDSGGQIQTILVPPYTYATICAGIGTVVKTSGDGSEQDLRSLCITDNDCEGIGTPFIPEELP